MDILKRKFIYFIEILERKSNIHLSTFAKSGVWSFSSHFFSVFFALIISYFFAHYLSQEEYGTYKYIVSLSGILGAFTLTGMNTAITRAVASGNVGVYLPSIKYQLKWNVLIFFASLIPVSIFFISGQKTIAVGFCIVSFLTVFLTTFNTYVAYLNGKKQFKILARFSVISALIQAISIIISILLFGNAIVVILVSFATQSTLAYLFHLKIKSTFPEIKNEGSWIKTINLGKKLSVNNIIKLISDQADKFIMFSFLGPQQLAVYAFAQGLPDQIRGVFKIIPSITLPHLAERTTEIIPKTFWTYLKALFFITLLTVIIYNIFAQLIFSVLFSTYLESVFYSRILSISMIPVVLTLPLATFLNARGNAKASKTLSTHTAIIEISSLLIGAYLFGFKGIVFGKVVSAIIVFLVAYFLVTRDHSTSQPVSNG